MYKLLFSLILISQIVFARCISAAEAIKCEPGRGYVAADVSGQIIA
jgi:hypothetical protein